MMCLGWTNKPTCDARGVVPLTPPDGTTLANPSATACADISWFWISAALIGVSALVKK